MGMQGTPQHSMHLGTTDWEAEGGIEELLYKF
jgi:hypothetical protein